MKKNLSYLLLLILFFQIILPFKTFASIKKKNFFIVTAYYSPLPNQKHYLKGNFEDEKKLNGNGIKGASGKKVFSGMLAAPKGYKFGTKIYLKGLGVGEVSDRGGAIVHAGNRGYNYDRIDLWVGYGDEGLKRALYWGKRKIEGYIVPKNTKISIKNKKIPSPNWTTKNLKKISNIFNIGLGKGSNIKDIKHLEQFLKEIGLYKGEIDGIYNSKLINLIYNFQIQNGLIKKGKLYGAGYWGHKTRNLILKKYINGDFNKKIKNLNNKSKKIINIFNKPIKTKNEIRQLEKILKKLNLFNGKIDGKYSSIKNIILNFQLKNNIIKNKYQIGAGYFGPSTRKKIEKKYNLYKQNIIKQQQEEKRKKDLEKEFNTLENLAKEEAKKEIESIGSPKLGEISIKVRKLQKKLKLLGYFNYKDTAIFGKLTQKALIKYQLDKKLIKSKKDIAAGIFGPNTQKNLIKDISKILLQQKLKEKKEILTFINKNKISTKEIAENITKNKDI